MDRSLELQLGDELLALARRGPLPAQRAVEHLPSDVYTSTERHATELATIARHPAAVIGSSEIAEPGSFVTLTLGGKRVIVARDRDGEAHAMYNTCAHRGSTVESRDAGTARAFSCPFHGWSYQLDGRLRSVSDADRFSTDTCTAGLTRLQCEERHGIVWVVADAAAPPMSVADWMGPADELLDELGLASMAVFDATEYDLDCNWKMLTDGFLELYHLKYLHRNSIAPYFPSDLTSQHRSGDHFVNWLPKLRLLAQLDERPRDDWDVLDHLTGAVVLMPATVVQWQAGHVELFSLRPDPVDPTRCVARLTMMVPGDRLDETDLWQRNWERVTTTIPDEDFAAAVDVQSNIDAGTIDHLRIGSNEQLLLDHLTALDKLATGAGG